MIWALPTAAAVAWLLAVRDQPGRLVAKPLASLGFVMIGLSGGPLETRYGTLVLAGLVLAAVGDVALMCERWFLAGLGSFALGHLAYVGAFTTVADPGPLALLAGGVVAIGSARWVLPHTAGAMRTAVAIYIVVIGAMLASALSAGSHAARIPLGAALFAASDLLVARERFMTRDDRNRLWGLPLYYAGQVLIASTVVG